MSVLGRLRFLKNLFDAFESWLSVHGRLDNCKRLIWWNYEFQDRSPQRHTEGYFELILGPDLSEEEGKIDVNVRPSLIVEVGAPRVYRYDVGKDFR